MKRKKTMPEIKRRTWGKNGWAWYYTWKENGKWKSIQSKNKDDIKNQVQQIESRLQNFTHKDILPLFNASNEYFNVEQQNKIKEQDIHIGHLLDEKSMYQNHIETLGNIDLKKIDTIWLRKFIEKKQKTLKTPYIKKIFHVFKKIYATNIKKGYAKSSPFIAEHFWEKRRSKYKRPKIDFNVWSFSKIQELISYVETKEVQMIFKLCTETACRPSESRVASRKNFMLLANNPYYKITNSLDRYKNIKSTKTENGVRDVSIGVDFKDEVVAYMNTLPKEQDYLFLNKRGNFIDLKRMTDELNKALAIMKNKYNLDPFVNRKTYMFRHWTASKWAYDGVFDNAMDLTETLGDSDTNFVYKTYIKAYKKNHNNHKISSYKDKNNKWSKPLDNSL